MKRKAPDSVSNASGKRAHVNDEDEDLLGDLDMEAHAARQTKLRRGRVMTQGYESDESDNESGAQRMRKINERGNAEDDEDEDMFAEASDKDEDDVSTTKKKSRFLKLSDIEGQEFGARTKIEDEDHNVHGNDGNDDEEDYEDVMDPEEDPEYEHELAIKSQRHEDANADAERTPPGSPSQKAQRGSVKKHGMGFRIEKFNMKSEMESGQFDEDGNYIRNARDKFSQNDRWLEGNYSRKSMKAASESQRRRKAAELEREKQQKAAFPTMEHAMKELVECMQPGESVLDALQRLGKATKSAKEQASSDQQSRAQFERLTHLAGVLMSQYGHMNVYDDVYEGLVRIVRRACLVPEDWDPSRPKENTVEAATTEETTSEHRAGYMWEYKWTPKYLAQMAREKGEHVNPEVQVFGPFSESQLTEWARHGYFGVNQQNIVVRPSALHTPSSASTSSWSTWNDAGLPSSFTT